MSLESQFDNLSKSWFVELKTYYRTKAELILQNGLKIFQESVPIDTLQLRDNIKGYINDISAGYEIIIEVPNTELNYQGRAINAIKLGLILQRGVGKKGVKLTRTKSNVQSFAKMGSPTEAWFDKAFEVWQNSINL